MTNLLHFTLGPVQGFVAQARRTRDLWAGSFLLSYLSGQAMYAVRKAGGEIKFPVVDNDDLLTAITEVQEGRPVTVHPNIGSLPNRFKAEVPDDFDPAGCRAAVLAAWEETESAIWDKYLKDVATEQTESIWRRQVEGFWDMNWVIGEKPQDPKDRSDNAWLDQRKNWRSYAPPEEPGDKCTLMGSWQELSGYTRATQREKQDHFWQEVRPKVGGLNLGESERLCAISFIKRLFPDVAKEAIGWELTTKSWPSTSYMAAVPWLREIQQGEDTRVGELAQAYPGCVKQHISSSFRGEFDTDLSCIKSTPFTQLDGQLYYRDAIESDKERNISAEGKRALQDQLGNLNNAVGHPPSPFYALLLMDGDSLGTLLQNDKPEPSLVSKALATFTSGVDTTVKKYCGKTVYAGGDDVLALLPLDEALTAATELRQSYLEAFDDVLNDKRPLDDEGKSLKTTISAGLVFAHYHTSLRAVMQEAHHLLDGVAKDGNERDSIAVSVLTGGGRTVEWVSSWDEKSAREPVPQILQGLSEDFDEQFASKFFYNVRSRFEILTVSEDKKEKKTHQLIKGLDATHLLVAEYKKSGDRTLEDDKPLSDKEIKSRIDKLLQVCRVRKHSEAEEDTLNISGAMLVRFLATKGRGVER